MLGRVAWFVYQGTEREDLPLHDKLQSLLALTLPLVHGSTQRYNRFEYKERDQESTEEEESKQPDTATF